MKALRTTATHSSSPGCCVTSSPPRDHGQLAGGAVRYRGACSPRSIATVPPVPPARMTDRGSNLILERIWIGIAHEALGEFPELSRIKDRGDPPSGHRDEATLLQPLQDVVDALARTSDHAGELGLRHALYLCTLEALGQQ